MLIALTGSPRTAPDALRRPLAPPASAARRWHLHQAPTQPVDPEDDAPEHPDEPPLPEPGLPV